MSAARRSANLSNNDKQRLVAIVHGLNCGTTLENKSKEKQFLLTKADVWKEIEAKLSSIPTPNSPKHAQQSSCRICGKTFEKTKKDDAKHRCSSFATGGGPSASPLDALSETVVNIMGSPTMDPISDVPDDDEDVPTTFVKSLSLRMYIAKS